MKTYVINLARSVERRAHMVAQMAGSGLDYEWVDAVDGRNLDLGDPLLFAPGLASRQGFRPGAAGCGLSHISAYDRIVERNEPVALVLEDDVELPDDIAALSCATAARMRAGEVVLLNFHFPGVLALTQEGAEQLPGGRWVAAPLCTEGLTSLGAYLITKEACERMRKCMLPMRDFPDNWGRLCQEGAFALLRCVAPMPVSNSAQFRTTIDCYPPGSFQLRVREAIAGSRAPVLHDLLVRRRRREFERRGWAPPTALVDAPTGSDDGGDRASGPNSSQSVVSSRTNSNPAT
ncbi:MAG TPA: glycosyltransferase family 25 protein [Acidimicrobiales bacterium]|nr:glycosyltransferase family 25 protein [Acidimicrobiales bacterium]